MKAYCLYCAYSNNNNQCMHIFIIPMMKHTVEEIEVVWACDQKRGTLCRKECDCNESTGEKEERKI